MENILENPDKSKSHIVLVGAGCSRAAYGKQSPLMNDFIDVVGLKDTLRNAGLNCDGNIENIYCEIDDNKLKKIVEDKIFNYFRSFCLPDSVTLYDQLLLSLSHKDAIYSFNWDPLLFDAYKRNAKVINRLPRIYFLHGNVRIASCSNCVRWGERENICPECVLRFNPIPLLYPIKKKNYFDGNKYIASIWQEAKSDFAEAFALTVFGYGAPDSDVGAIEILLKAWYQNSARKLDRVEIIDLKEESELREKWDKFTPEGRLEIIDSFEKSRIYKFPRRTCEQLVRAIQCGYSDTPFPYKETGSLKAIQSEAMKIAQYEAI